MNKIIFCDFDGTITAQETFVAMLKQFTPQISAEIMPKLYNRELTLRQGVRQMLESIPSVRYQEVIEFSHDQHIRPGLVELIDFLDDQAVPLVVVSGGIRVMVETVLGELVNRVAAIYAVDIATQGEYWQVHSEFESGTELVAKVKIMDLYEHEEKVAIGDSVTDLNMALSAPLVFARDRLAQYLDEQQKPYIVWNDFWEVRDYLARHWNL
ncbi:HAD phosphoserine phosphatase-like hydrolase, IB family protein [Lyngbya aestuarii BL J]|uniref:HAD phosphoserine phosphatase-like hydrolase, IB family protein n=1 Tax=Lyngbya aestuarii BL J TaxID=1348334 RepID=U7QF41_9CYAN|nr:HAD-IB family phosphatase [Lyngbya aestuarii]ERT06513.1 HAD phosphoserine phosphatase-like hydrolase, IB family protein [Lyngbya aestuarii BL J]